MEVVLLSGGLDSSTVLAHALNQAPQGSEVHCLTINYGQKHSRELKAAAAIADHYGVYIEALEIPTVFRSRRGAASALVDERPMPQMKSYKELETAYGPSPTVVPFRNGVLIALATVYGITHVHPGQKVNIWFGAHGEDARNWAYPDCTPEFLGSMAAAVFVGSYEQVRLCVPFQFDTKVDIVRKGYNHNVPFELTWSCYEGGDNACGVCPTCIERLNAFAANGLEDPIVYTKIVAG